MFGKHPIARRRRAWIAEGGDRRSTPCPAIPTILTILTILPQRHDSLIEKPRRLDVALLPNPLPSLCNACRQGVRGFNVLIHAGECGAGASRAQAVRGSWRCPLAGSSAPSGRGDSRPALAPKRRGWNPVVAWYP